MNIATLCSSDQLISFGMFIKGKGIPVGCGPSFSFISRACGGSPRTTIVTGTISVLNISWPLTAYISCAVICLVLLCVPYTGLMLLFSIPNILYIASVIISQLEEEGNSLAHCHCIDSRGPRAGQASKRMCKHYCKLPLRPRDCRAPPTCSATPPLAS